MKTAPQISSTVELEEILLKNRGIKTEEEKERFFNPNLESYQKDFELSGIKTAISRIQKAISESEQIFIYGDYDADGLTSTAIIYLALKNLGAKVLPYIPHREKEGYGLSKIGIDSCLSQDAKLIITVDNGIVAFEQSEYAKSKGLDLIITDHHEALDKRPEAVAIVHSTKMCGAGVVWSLVRELIGQEKAAEYLDLAAIGSICDLIPLIGVNRSLVKEGLKRMNKNLRPGVGALAVECKLEDQITAYTISHILGPRLNAAGRLDSAMDALRLLCTQDDSKARILAKRLCSSNDLKKQLTTEAIDKAHKMINESTLENKKIILLHSTEWIPGIIGLMAGRISEEFKLPAIIISENGVISKGSARTVNGVNIIETLRQCSDLLIDVGGHKKAAGFTIETSKINLLEKRLNKILSKSSITITEDEEAEICVVPSKVTRSWIRTLDKFEPFGMDNQKPLFTSKNAVVDDLRGVGLGKHLKLKIDGVDAIAFSYGEYLKLLKPGGFVDVNFYPEINKFNGNETLQFKITDLKVANH